MVNNYDLGLVPGVGGKREGGMNNFEVQRGHEQFWYSNEAVLCFYVLIMHANMVQTCIGTG